MIKLGETGSFAIYTERIKGAALCPDRLYFIDVIIPFTPDMNGISVYCNRLVLKPYIHITSTAIYGSGKLGGPSADVDGMGAEVVAELQLNFAVCISKAKCDCVFRPTQMSQKIVCPNIQWVNRRNTVRFRPRIPIVGQLQCPNTLYW